MQTAGIQDFREFGAPGDMGVFQATASIIVYQFTFSGVTYIVAQRMGVRGWILPVPPNIDAATVINAAINALTTGGKVFIKSGIYLLNTTLLIKVSNIVLQGEGWSSILKINTNTNINMIQIGEADVNIILRGIQIKELKLDGNQVNQASQPQGGIYLNGRISQSAIESCWILDQKSNGIYFKNALRSAGDKYWVDNNLIFNNYFSGPMWAIKVAGDAHWNQHIISNYFWSANGIYYIPITNGEVGGDRIELNMFTGGSRGIWVETLATNKCYDLQIIGNHFDYLGYPAISSYCASGSMNQHHLILGNIIVEQYSHGIALYGSKYNIIKGNIFWANSYGYAIGTCDDIYLAGWPVVTPTMHSTYNQIEGNVFAGEIAGTNWTRYGVNEGDANQDYNIIQGNHFRNFTIAPVRTQGPNTKVRFNQGYVTENTVLSPAFAIDGVATVTVTIPHGLAITPAIQDCSLTVVEDTNVDDWGYNLVKVDNVGAVNVVAKVNVSVASATGGATAKLSLRVGKE